MGIISEAHEEYERSRDDLLNRAMTIVEAAVAWQEDTGHCHFCAYGLRDDGQTHDEDCPLVVELFIERNGART